MAEEKKKAMLREKIQDAVRAVKETNPMAGSVTNTVTMNFVANAQLAVGGSAAMVFLPDEGEFLVSAGNAVYCNVGTLIPISRETLPRTAKAAHEAGKVCVLDPVGIGIGSLRTEILTSARPYRPKIIRGNASEIIALRKLWKIESGTFANKARGVDSTESVDQAAEAAVELANYTGGAVAVSGASDLVTDGSIIVRTEGGSEMMTRVTGSGCSLGGVMAVYACVTDPFTAALTGALVYNLAGERAEKKAEGPGTFYAKFLDELYLAKAEEIASCSFTVTEV